MKESDLELGYYCNANWSMIMSNQTPSGDAIKNQSANTCLGPVMICISFNFVREIDSKKHCHKHEITTDSQY